MRLTTPRPSDWLVALVVLASMLFYLWPATPWATVLAPASGAAVLYVRQAPIAATGVLAALQFAMVPLDIASENPAPLAPMLIAVYTLGRHGGLLQGIVATIVYVTSFLVRDFTVATVGFMTVVLGGVFTFGLLVQGRSARASTAHQAANAVADTNIAGHTANIVADERARLGGQALAVIRGSVDLMRQDAADAALSLDPHLIARISDRGRTAITELRWLLGLLRTDADVSPAEPVHRNHRWVLDSGVAAVLILLTMLDRQLPGQPAVTSFGLILLITLPLTIVVRHTYPLAACLVAAAIVVAIPLSGNPLFIGFGVGSMVTLSLLAWSAAVTGGRALWCGLAGLVLVTVLPVMLTAPGNIPMTLALLVVPAFAGHEWSARDRERQRAEERASSMQVEIDRRVELAVRAERLRLARELHDVTSHAVGVMVLQSSAADAVKRTDPVAARRALHTVETVGAKALTELGLLFQLLDAGAIGGPGLAAPEVERVDDLVDRMRATGLRIDFTRRCANPDNPGDFTGPAAATVYRVVQEALTNVARHAPGASARVELVESAREAHVRVTDDGSGFHPTVTGSGFGLAGLAERVRAAGGQFAAGPLEAAGFEVWAHVFADVDETAQEVRAGERTERAEAP